MPRNQNSGQNNGGNGNNKGGGGQKPIDLTILRGVVSESFGNFIADHVRMAVKNGVGTTKGFPLVGRLPIVTTAINAISDHFSPGSIQTALLQGGLNTAINELPFSSWYKRILEEGSEEFVQAATELKGETNLQRVNERLGETSARIRERTGKLIASNLVDFAGRVSCLSENQKIALLDWLRALPKIDEKSNMSWEAKYRKEASIDTLRLIADKLAGKDFSVPTSPEAIKITANVMGDLQSLYGKVEPKPNPLERVKNLVGQELKKFVDKQDTQIKKDRGILNAKIAKDKAGESHSAALRWWQIAVLALIVGSFSFEKVFNLGIGIWRNTNVERLLVFIVALVAAAAISNWFYFSLGRPREAAPPTGGTGGRGTP